MYVCMKMHIHKYVETRRHAHTCALHTGISWIATMSYTTSPSYVKALRKRGYRSECARVFACIGGRELLTSTLADLVGISDPNLARALCVCGCVRVCVCVAVWQQGVRACTSHELHARMVHLPS